MESVGPTPGPIYARAVAAWHRGQNRLALQHLQHLLGRWPRHADAHNLAGVVHLRTGDPVRAAHHLLHALQLGAGPGTLVNLGMAYQKLRDYDQAARAFSRALSIDPGFAPAWQKQAALLELTGQPGAALRSYRRAVQLQPGDLKSKGDALFLRRRIADWSPDPLTGADRLLEGFRAAARSDFPPLLLLALPEADAHAQKLAGRLFSRSQWAHLLDSTPLHAPPTRDDDRPLRVGYLSSDFRNHAVSFLALETIAAHDREAVTVVLYSHGPGADDEWRQTAIAAADRFVDIGGMEDAAAAQQIARDRIDVLVDLNGYTLHARTGILARRPAPVIASWLGYVATLGEPRLADYVIGDPIATPPSSAGQFSETLALMPRCFQPNGRLHPLPSALRQDEGLPADALVFCSFNQTFKLHPALWDDWCEILRGVPGSVLWLAPPRYPDGELNLRSEAERRNVDPARIHFAKRRGRTAHLARVALADLALDTWPYNSGTTASDALRAGVPLLSFLGETFASRMAGSLLHGLGLPECVAPDRRGVVEMAIRLGRDGPARHKLRRRLAARLSESALFRPDLFARDLERLLRAMHLHKRAGRDGVVTLPP